MSLLQTKPNWFRGECIATERGWVNPKNNEVLVAIGNLKVKLELEIAKTTKVEVRVESADLIELPVFIEPKIIKVKEIKMEKKPVVAKKVKVIGEVTEKNIPAGKQIIAEVVEYDLDKPIIGE